MRWNMGRWRLWLFGGLVAVAAGLMVRSFILPWWVCIVSCSDPDYYIAFPVKVYGYGIPSIISREEIFEYIAMEITPFYQTVFAWIFLAASVGLILFSTWLRGRKGRWLLGGIGLIYIAYAAIAIIWVAIRTGDFGVSLQGHSLIREIFPIETDASLQFGYYLAHAAGLMCITLALLRNKIIGKPKLGA